MFIDLNAGGGAGGAFLTDVGLNGGVLTVVVVDGACLDAASAYEGKVLPALVAAKLNLVDGKPDPRSIRSSVLAS